MAKIKTNKWILYALVLLVIMPFVNAWSGPPPTDVVFYGYAYINGTPASPGTVVSVWANNGALQMDTDVVVAGGYFVGINIKWNDPDTPADEGITYADNAESITFKLNGLDVQYPSSTYVVMADAGKSKEINLNYTYNFAPVLDFIPNQTIAQDSLLKFNITAFDDNSYRDDTLTFSKTGVTTLTQINNTLATITWTPDWQNACIGGYDVTYEVEDDGIPQKSDSQIMHITVTNVNDPPSISNADIGAINNTLKNIDLVSVLSYYDRDSCLGDGKTFTDITGLTYENATFAITNALTGASTFIANHTGTYQYVINVSDDAGASDTDVLTITVTKPAIPDVVVLIKNIYYISQTNETVIYEITDTVYNFLGYAVTGINLLDPDCGINETFNLADKSSISFSANATIQKTNLTYLFARASALVNGALYYSNQPKILIPGIGAFDISIDVPAVVAGSQPITGDITIINQGTDSQDVILDYWIEDLSGNIYNTGQKTVYVNANSTLNTTATLTAPSTWGQYRFFAKVRWGPDNTSTATAYDSFSVVTVTPTPSAPASGAGPAAVPVEVIPPEVIPEVVPPEVPPEVILPVPILKPGVILLPTIVIKLWWLWLILILLAVIFYMIYKRRKKAAKEKARAKAYKSAVLLGRYIKNAIKSGYSKQKIKQSLLDKGWPKLIIDSYYDYLWKKYKK